MLNTPEHIFFVTLVCQPVTLLVTLWGMISGQTIAVMRANIHVGAAAAGAGPEHRALQNAI
jgi:hypothetical protein